MRAAIYTRYSTDKQDSNSTAAQIRNCKQLVDREGLNLVDTYGDEGISGSDNERPDYRRLLRDSEAGRFDVIVVDETSRLTRAPGELQQQLAWLKFRGQRLIDCRGFDSDHNGAGLLASVSNFMDEQELEKIRHRTRRGQREVVLLDFNPGGRLYGYSSEPVQTDGKRRWRSIVVPEQAEVVVDIFEQYAAGVGLKAIAEYLNDQGIASPGSTWRRQKRRCKGWVHSAVRGILLNERYLGRLIWNRTRWIRVPFTSRRKRVDRPRDEWVIRDVPALRIVSDDLWQRVQDRFNAPSRRAQAKAQKRRMGRPPKHLLSGIMVCDCCGANMVIESRGRYACSSRTNGAKKLCDNNLRVDSKVAEVALLSGIQDQLLSDEMVAYVRRSVRERMKAASTPQTDISRLKARLSAVQAKVGRVVEAIESVGVSASLSTRLSELEKEEARVAEKVAAAGREAAAVVPDIIPGLVDRYRDLVSGIATLGTDPSVTTDDVGKAREVLRALFGRIRVEPRGDRLVAKVATTGAGLAAASPTSISQSFVVAGAGFEPATFGL